VTPLVGSVICFAVARFRRGAVHPTSILFLSITLFCSLLVAANAFSGDPELVSLLGSVQTRLPTLSLRTDGLSTTLTLLASAICLLCALCFRPYGLTAQNGLRYSSLVLALSAALNGVFLSADLLLMLAFWELMIITSYLLIVQPPRASTLFAARKYFVMSQIAVALILVSVAIVYQQTNSTLIGPVKAAFLGPQIPWVVFGLLSFLGFGIEAALVPMHVWLPDAHSESPTPVSALLSSVVVCTGIYGMLRFSMSYGVALPWRGLMLGVGFSTALVGGFLAIFESDGKRLIAMSTIAQLGLIVAGLGTGLAVGSAAAILHTINHAFGKALLFLSAGWVMATAGTRDLAGLRRSGLRHSPLLFGSFAVGVLSISGIPPFSAYFSKTLIGNAVLQGGFPLLALGLKLAGGLTILAYLRLGWHAFGGQREKGCSGGTSWTILLVCLVLAALCLALGLIAPWLLKVVGERMVPTGTNGGMGYGGGPLWLSLTGYLGLLLGGLAWLKRATVHSLLLKANLGFVEGLGRREMYFDEATTWIGGKVVELSENLSRLSTGRIRDYGFYLIASWVLGLLLIFWGWI